MRSGVTPTLRRSSRTAAPEGVEVISTVVFGTAAAGRAAAAVGVATGRGGVWSPPGTKTSLIPGVGRAGVASGSLARLRYRNPATAAVTTAAETAAITMMFESLAAATFPVTPARAPWRMVSALPLIVDSEPIASGPRASAPRASARAKVASSSGKEAVSAVVWGSRGLRLRSRRRRWASAASGLRRAISSTRVRVCWSARWAAKALRACESAAAESGLRAAPGQRSLMRARSSAMSAADA
jgi:hypothetical protein